MGLKVDWDWIAFCCDFIDSFMVDVTYVRDDKVICYIPGCICYGCEYFGLGSVYDDYVGLSVTKPQFYSIAPCRFDYGFVDEQFVFYRWVGFFPH